MAELNKIRKFQPHKQKLVGSNNNNTDEEGFMGTPVKKGGLLWKSPRKGKSSANGKKSLGENGKLSVQDAVKSTVKDIQKKLDSKQKMCEDVEDRMRDMEEKLLSVSKSEKYYTDAYHEIKAVFEKKSKALLELENNFTNKSSDFTELNDRFLKTADDNKKQKQEIIKLKNDIRASQESASMVTAQILDSESKIMNLQQKLTSKMDESQKLTQSLEDARQAQVAQDTELEILQAQIKELQVSIEALRQENSDLEFDIGEKLQELTELENTKDRQLEG